MFLLDKNQSIMNVQNLYNFDVHKTYSDFVEHLINSRRYQDDMSWDLYTVCNDKYSVICRCSILYIYFLLYIYPFVHNCQR